MHLAPSVASLSPLRRTHWSLRVPGIPHVHVDRAVHCRPACAREIVCAGPAPSGVRPGSVERCTLRPACRTAGSAVQEAAKPASATPPPRIPGLNGTGRLTVMSSTYILSTALRSRALLPVSSTESRDGVVDVLYRVTSRKRLSNELKILVFSDHSNRLRCWSTPHVRGRARDTRGAGSKYVCSLDSIVLHSVANGAGYLTYFRPFTFAPLPATTRLPPVFFLSICLCLAIQWLRFAADFAVPVLSASRPISQLPIRYWYPGRSVGTLATALSLRFLTALTARSSCG